VEMGNVVIPAGQIVGMESQANEEEEFDKKDVSASHGGSIVQAVLLTNSESNPNDEMFVVQAVTID
jgi:hypothetical protein